MLDLISRKDAISILQKEINKFIPPLNDTELCMRYGIRLSRNIIEDLPAIDAVPVVRGKWIPGREISREMIGDCTVSIEYEDYKCSVCGFGIDRIAHWKDGTPVVKYCPNCGARMEKKNG